MDVSKFKKSKNIARNVLLQIENDSASYTTQNRPCIDKLSQLSKAAANDAEWALNGELFASSSSIIHLIESSNDFAASEYSFGILLKKKLLTLNEKFYFKME